MCYFSLKELSKVTSYKAGQTFDHSLLYKYLISPACAFLVVFFPTWLAPNVLTLGGLLCNILAFLLSLIYVPNGEGEAPRWVYFAIGALIFCYMMLDNTDGKQAVRTGSSSPLGELLDHGCDSLCIAMGCITTASVIQAGTWKPLIYASVGFIAFYLAHWQECFSDRLELGLLGPTEAEVMAIVIYWISFLVGPNIWLYSIRIGHYLLPLNDIILFGILLTTSAAALTSFFSGLILARKRNISMTSALLQLTPFVISYGSAVLWMVGWRL